MRILVCISVVPDTTTKISFVENNTQFNTSGVNYIINPYDELALTKALEITEANGGSVTICHVGLETSDANIRKALSIGAEQAIRINAFPTDTQFVAEQIAAIATDYDIIFTGRESIDFNGGAVAGLVGAILNIPTINVVTEISLAGNVATIEHDIDGGRAILEVSTPFVLSAQKDLCEPRIPNMKSIMMARTKPLNVLEPINTNVKVVFENYSLPAAKKGVQLIDANNPEELISLLKTNKII